MISVFQDYKVNIESHRSHFANLVKIRELLGGRYIDLQVNGDFRATHYVGFVSMGNTRLQILPKIYAGSGIFLEEGQEQAESLRFLYKMLEWSGSLPLKHLDPQSISGESYDLLELFAGIFIDQFLFQFRRDIHREYIPREENLPLIRGKILFPQTLKKNQFKRHFHYVRYEEFSIDNPLNQFFRRLMRVLIGKVNTRSTKNMLRMGLAYLEEVRDCEVSKQFIDQIRFNRQNEHYLPLFNLGRMFFQSLNPGLAVGEEHTFGYLVRVYQLFEECIGKFLRDFSTDDVKIQHHSPKKPLYWEGGEEKGKLQPDFTIQVNGKIRCILDTKYKYPFNSNGTVSISEKDVYQLATYSLRYNCRNLVLIYPRFVGAPLSSPLLTEYTLPSPYGRVYLRVVQVDLQNHDPEGIKAELWEGCGLDRFINVKGPGQ